MARKPELSPCTCNPSGDGHWRHWQPQHKGVDHFGRCGHSELFRTTRLNPTANQQYASAAAKAPVRPALSSDALPSGLDVEALLGLLDRRWAMRLGERRALRAFARAWECTTHEAKRRLLCTGIAGALVDREQPQSVRLGSKWVCTSSGQQRRDVRPALDLSSVDYRAWFIAKAVHIARSTLSDREPCGLVSFSETEHGALHLADGEETTHPSSASLALTTWQSLLERATPTQQRIVLDCCEHRLEAPTRATAARIGLKWENVKVQWGLLRKRVA